MTIGVTIGDPAGIGPELVVRVLGGRPSPLASPEDVRVFVTPGSGLFAHWTTVHELGHAAQALLAPPEGPQLLRRTASRAVL